MENTINLPQWLARENGINRVVAVEEQVKTTRGAVVLKVTDGAEVLRRLGTNERIDHIVKYSARYNDSRCDYYGDAHSGEGFGYVA